MKTILLKNFNLQQTADSGQCFRMVRRENGSYSLISREYYLEISQEGESFYFDCPEEDLPFWRHYFDLDTDYGAFIASVRPRDLYLKQAAEAGSGIRILNQDLWEMMITFLISQQKTIPLIRDAVELLSETYGTLRSVRMADGSERRFYSFPTPEQLSRASLDDLRAAKLGYRAKYIHKLCQDVSEGSLDLDRLSSLDSTEAMEGLTALYGIGKKVANCICLFGLHHIDAFPVDTWIEQILTKYYYPKNPGKYKKIPKSRRFDAMVQDYFGCYQGFAGVMQQYIFYYERSIVNGKK